MEATKAAAEEKRRLLSEAAVVIVAAAAAVAPAPLQLPKFGRERDPQKIRVKKRVSKTTNLTASRKNKAFSSSMIFLMISPLYFILAIYYEYF